jgi:thioredoxin-related protein
MTAFMSVKTPISLDSGINSEINWISLEEAEQLNSKKKKARPIIIDFYTDWCGWCKRMDKETFSDSRIAAYINENFYAVKFDAEQEASLELQGKVYKFQQGGRRGTHEFALDMASVNGRIGFPTTVFLDENFEPIGVHPGYLSAAKLDAFLKYYGEDYYQDFDFGAFSNMYDSPWK